MNTNISYEAATEWLANHYEDVIKHCKTMLGYSGSMPLEVENQSEDAK